MVDFEYRLSAGFREVISPDGRQVLYIDSSTGYWFSVQRIFQPFISRLQQGVAPGALGYPVPGWEDIVSRLERDSQFGHAATRLRPEPRETPRVSLVIVEPSGYCNLSCRYCFENIPTQGRRMTRETADEIINKMKSLDLADNILVEFAGGEPLLNLPIMKYFVETVSRRCRSGELTKSVSFTIQSNGTVMTRDIAAFLREWEISIGVSLDGPASIHNRNRIFRGGKGSWDSINRTLDTLRHHEVPFGLLSVIESAEDVEPVYEHLVSQNPVIVRLNVRRVNGRSGTHLPEATLTEVADAHYAVFKRSLDTLRQSGHAVREANICHMIENMVTRAPRYMCQRTPCGAGADQIVFDHTGTSWACQEFVGDERFNLGRVNDGAVGGTAESRRTLALLSSRRLEDAEECRSCPWMHFCQGGCFATTYHATDANLAAALRRKTPHCAYFKRLFSKLVWDVCSDYEALLQYALCPERGFPGREKNEAGAAATKGSDGSGVRLDAALGGNR